MKAKPFLPKHCEAIKMYLARLSPKRRNEERLREVLDLQGRCDAINGYYSGPPLGRASHSKGPKWSQEIMGQLQEECSTMMTQ